jgi:hypothetical protein
MKSSAPHPETGQECRQGLFHLRRRREDFVAGDGSGGTARTPTYPPVATRIPRGRGRVRLKYREDLQSPWDWESSVGRERPLQTSVGSHVAAIASRGGRAWRGSRAGGTKGWKAKGGTSWWW